MNVHFSSKSTEWETPDWFFDQLNAEFHFTLDPCCAPENAKCTNRFTKTENGLIQNWGTHRVFMNPPYGRSIGEWMQKAYSASQGGGIGCLPSSRAHRYSMVARLRNEGRSALSSRTPQIQQSQMERAISLCGRHF